MIEGRRWAEPPQVSTFVKAATCSRDPCCNISYSACEDHHEQPFPAVVVVARVWMMYLLFLK